MPKCAGLLEAPQRGGDPPLGPSLHFLIPDTCKGSRDAHSNGWSRKSPSTYTSSLCDIESTTRACLIDLFSFVFKLTANAMHEKNTNAPKNNTAQSATDLSSLFGISIAPCRNSFASPEYSLAKGFGVTVPHGLAGAGAAVLTGSKQHSPGAQPVILQESRCGCGRNVM